MMNSKLNEIFKKILNDKRIYYVEEVYIDKNEMLKLRALYEERNKEKIINFISQKQVKNLRIKEIYENYPVIFNSIINTLDKIGLIKNNLWRVNLNDLGIIIETQPQSIIETFFLEKAKKQSRFGKQAIYALLDYVKEAIESELQLEISYIVRKLDVLYKLYHKMEL